MLGSYETEFGTETGRAAVLYACFETLNILPNTSKLQFPMWKYLQFFFHRVLEILNHMKMVCSHVFSTSIAFFNICAMVIYPANIS